MSSVKISNEQAATIAAAIRPQIKAYIEAHREKYEAFLQAEKDAAISSRKDSQ